MTRSFELKENYKAIFNLPAVQDLLKKIENLEKKNKSLKKKNNSLKTVVYTFPEFIKESNQKPSHQQMYGKLRKSKSDNNIIIKEEKVEEPTLCEPLTDNDDVVYVPIVEKENIVYDLTEEDSVNKIIIKEEINQLQELIISNKPEFDEEEVEVEEEEEEEEVQEVEEEIEEEAEVFEITIKGKSYYTTDEKNGKIYSITQDEDVGDEIGEFKNGIPKFYKPLHI
jgi:hypothetical protein